MHGRFSHSMSAVPASHLRLPGATPSAAEGAEEPARYALVCGGSDRDRLFGDVLLLDAADMALRAVRIEPTKKLPQRCVFCFLWFHSTQSTDLIDSFSASQLLSHVHLGWRDESPHCVWRQDFQHAPDTSQ